MSLVFEHKGYVCGNVLWGLIPLLWKGDLSAFLPAFLYDDVKDFVFCSHAPTIWIQSAAGDFHPLGASMENLFQRDLQLMDHRRVLVSLISPESL